jgi:hypothetical protein
MASGLYPNTESIERYAAASTTTWSFSPFITSIDLDVIGMAVYLTTALSSAQTLKVNATVTPNSQIAAASSTGVDTTYNLWTTANVPTVASTGATPAGNGRFNYTLADTYVVKPGYGYALNYPLPGAPDGSTTGFITAQQTTKGSNSGAAAYAPNFVELGAPVLKAPDNVYIGINDLAIYGGTGVATTPANIIHAGDTMTFTVTSSGTLSSTAVLAVLYCNKA